MKWLYNNMWLTDVHKLFNQRFRCCGNLLTLRSLLQTIHYHSGNNTLYISSCVSSTPLTSLTIFISWFKLRLQVRFCFFLPGQYVCAQLMSHCVFLCHVILERVASTKPNKQVYIVSRSSTLFGILITQHPSHRHHEDGNSLIQQKAVIMVLTVLCSALWYTV